MLNNGKHVLCEKPLTLNSKQCSELIELAEKKNLFLMEAVWSRCFPIYDVIKKEIESGNIGDVMQVIVSFGFKLDQVDRVSLKRYGGGTIFDLGVYVLEFASFIFNGEEPTVIKAAGHLNDDGVDVSVSATLTYKNKRTAIVLTHSIVKLENEAQIIGTRGTIKVPDFWCPIKIELPTGKVEIPLPKAAHLFNFYNSAGLRYEAIEARACLKAGMLLQDILYAVRFPFTQGELT
ncbi:trans-1,2-dihydrobenzene-1,2-diol dehydrogenase-like [Cephus cinctus]|uniref:Trans-1,2-dihydrobenzene-1,2-diol dehydrogenase n=1 Tax=Cephus cinctus TaxID=211228 RepID=A0AAJ7BKS7_CEPCN|nr:trans-1,2-dihydrobenzene-1,2-diol dehydrogenase-like [Cephus cinctus]